MGDGHSYLCPLYLTCAPMKTWVGQKFRGSLRLSGLFFSSLLIREQLPPCKLQRDLNRIKLAISSWGIGLVGKVRYASRRTWVQIPRTHVRAGYSCTHLQPQGWRVGVGTRRHGWIPGARESVNLAESVSSRLS